MTLLRRGVTDPALAGIVFLAAGAATAVGWVAWPALGQWLLPHAGLVVMFGIGGVLLATAVVRAVRGAPRRRRRGAPRALSWWVIAAGGVVVVGVAWGATAWLLGEADQAKDPAAARVEAIKTGLTIGAGTGGVFALLLAVRRQWHQELSAAATEHDAAERRVTELYTKAVEQLGSTQAPVHMGGLYALERVAQNTPEQRQTVVNVLCAYLRMPFTLPSTSPRRLGIRRRPGAQHSYHGSTQPREASTTSAGAVREELEVRLAAQGILTMHLQPGFDTFWEDIDLNLANATLISLDLSGCRARYVTFDRATFTGSIACHVAKFTGRASFRGAKFDFAWFSNVEFTDQADFSLAEFTDYSLFGAKFAGPAIFDRTKFTSAPLFMGCEFIGSVSFTDAEFPPTTRFANTTFGEEVPPEVKTYLMSTSYDQLGTD